MNADFQQALHEIAENEAVIVTNDPNLEYEEAWTIFNALLMVSKQYQHNARGRKLNQSIIQSINHIDANGDACAQRGITSALRKH